MSAPGALPFPAGRCVVSMIAAFVNQTLPLYRYTHLSDEILDELEGQVGPRKGR